MKDKKAFVQAAKEFAQNETDNRNDFYLTLGRLANFIESEEFDKALKNTKKENKMSDTEKLTKIGNLIVSQDNRCTRDPMFCVQVNKRIVGLVEGFGDGNCWHDSSDFESGIVYERPEDSDSDKWERYGYADNWVTVMVAFTEEGCKEHLRLNGHNYRNYDGVRIYVESFRRCPEMLEIREWLINQSSDKRGE